MRLRAHFRSLRLILLFVAILPFMIETAWAADNSMPWNPKFTPAVSRAQAIRLARKYLGREAREFTSLSTHLVSMRRDHAAGEWRVTFEGKPDVVGKQVVVAFQKGRPNAGVRVFKGAMAR